MPDENTSSSPSQRPQNKDEVALELMKFVAVTSNYAKGTTTAGFGGKPSRTPEEHADALLALYERCREVVGKFE
jgi:hypothetical protein